MSSVIESKVTKEASLCTLLGIEKEITEILAKSASLESFEYFKNYLTSQSNHPLYLYILEFSFLEAVKKNKIEEVKYLLSLNLYNVTVHIEDRDSNTPLILACSYASKEMVQLLINQGADLKHCNIHGYSPYLSAVKLQRKDITSFLDSLHPSLKYETTELGMTLFSAACEGGDIELMKSILEKDPKICDKKGKKLCFTQAAAGGSIRAMELILKYSPNAYEHVESNEETGFEVFPLDAAAFNGQVECMQWLLDKDPKAYERAAEKEYTPILFAMNSGSIAVVELILKLDPKALAKVSRYIFMKAMSSGSVPLAEFLLKQCPEIYDERDLFQFLSGAIVSDSISAIEFILKLNKEAYKTCGPNGATPYNATIDWLSFHAFEYLFNLDPPFWNRDYAGSWITPFFSAVSKGNIAMMDFLLKQDPSVLNRVMIGSDTNALSLGIFNGHLNVIKFLLSKGAKLEWKNFTRIGNIDLKKSQPLLDYVKEASLIFRKTAEGGLLFIKDWAAKGNSLNLRDKYGNTLLHIALQYSEAQIAIYLLEQGVSITALNDKNETPFQFSLRKDSVYGLYVHDKVSIFKTMLDVFKYRASEIEKNTSIEALREKKINELREEFDALIHYAEGKGYVDYEAIIEFDKKYRIKWADSLYRVKKPDIHVTSEGLQKFNIIENRLYCASKHKLSDMIYNSFVICKESLEGTLEFSLPEEVECDKNSISLEGEGTGLSETEEPKESDEARRTRLKWAETFALEGENFEVALKVLIQSTNPDIQYDDFFKVSESAKDIKSAHEMILQFMKISYRPKKQEPTENLENLGKPGAPIIISKTLSAASAATDTRPRCEKESTSKPALIVKKASNI